MITDVDFKNYRRKEDIHGTVLYPAVMVAPVQRKVLKGILNHEKIRSVFDPFHGSGTSLYEAMSLSDDISLFGCDINPLANLITKVKLQGTSHNVSENINKLKIFIRKNESKKERYTFPNSEKWFRDDIAISLTLVRNAIRSISCLQDRLYFWLVFSDIVRKFSNTRSSTYKLHCKDEKKINDMVNNVIPEFLKSIEKNVGMFDKKSTNFYLYKSDIMQKIKDFKDKSFDITITSPPYGDNATTIPYGQFSMLSLYWIDNADLETEGWEFESYSKIDSKSMGGCETKIRISNADYKLIKYYLDKIDKKKTKKVLRFFSSYFSFLREMCRVTKKYVIMTLGNRTVDGININLTTITEQYLNKHDFHIVNKYKRAIYNKRTPQKTSSVNNQPVSSMNEEYIIIYKRNSENNIIWYLNYESIAFISCIMVKRGNHCPKGKRYKYYYERDGSL